MEFGGTTNCRKSLQVRPGNRKAIVFALHCAAFFVVLTGCNGQRDHGQGSLQEANMPSEEKSGDGDAKPIPWTLGPPADGDSAHDIVFRGDSTPKVPNNTPQQAVVPPPMIQARPRRFALARTGADLWEAHSRARELAQWSVTLVGTYDAAPRTPSPAARQRRLRRRWGAAGESARGVPQ